jgi:hypothetical protein
VTEPWSYVIVLLAVAPVVALLVWAVADLIRRTDTTVARKALWLVPVVVFPLVGPVVYLIFRPRRTPDIRGFGGRRRSGDPPGGPGSDASVR